MTKFPGLHLCGLENIAIVRIRFVTIFLSLIWPGIVMASGAVPSVLNFFYGFEEKSLYDDLKSNSASLLNAVLPLAALTINIAVKLYSGQLHQQMAKADSVYIIFGAKTKTGIKQEEKFSFSLGSVIIFPVLVLLTFLTSFASRNLRLLLFFPIQMSLTTIALPCYIIYNNSKIKQRASNTVSVFSENFKIYQRRLKTLRSSRVAPKVLYFKSEQCILKY